MRTFAGLELGRDAIPDETTIAAAAETLYLTLKTKLAITCYSEVP